MPGHRFAAGVIGLACAAWAGLAHAQSPVPPRRTLARGLVVQSVPATISSSASTGGGTLTLVRIDPKRFRFRLLTAEGQGGRRTAPEWANEFALTGVINASMFQPGGRSTGLMVDGDRVNNGMVNPYFGAFLVFDPTSPDAELAAMFGRGCPGFDLDEVRRRYGVVIQNYRLLDCDRRPISWRDEKAYSVAAVAIDRDGWIVFIHSRAPHRVREFNAMIAEPNLGLTAAMFVEGGSEASLFVRTERETIQGTGGSSAGFWKLPNVIGFAPRPTSDGGSR